MVSLIKQQRMMNETRENQGVLDYVCTPSSHLLSLLFGKLLGIYRSGYSLLRHRPNFDECCSCIYEACIAGLEKMTGHLAIKRDKNTFEHGFYRNIVFR